jgi:hypothetical protein
MSHLLLDLPNDDFVDEVLWEAKGYFPGAQLTVSGKRYDLMFYDPVRLRQDVESELERGEVFFEPNLVIIQSVTRANMERAAALLVESGQVASLVARRAD